MKHIFLALFAAGTLHAADPVMLTLSDFTDAKGAKPGPGWVAEDGGVIHRTARQGDLISVKEYSNVEIEWDWKVAEGANSGLKYWVNNFGKSAEKPNWLGIEYQMIDDDRHPDAHHGDNHSTACIYDIKAGEPNKAVKKAGEWNTSKIILKDGKIQHILNGKLAAEADTHAPEWQDLIAKSKFSKVSGFAPGKGHLLLQDHGDEVWFRNVRVKEL